ncbi:hypothetical protein [Jeotgalibacillus campisalis]|uniref:Uncharacterized protein n=1 Tax=Jeotgalibacillus campisalis TaxID=220754 RepID=A0A0C2VVI6_9BACL|nr:hypothetical protein [Jeotgalibacillus campisalis]KIL52917.1 hypothetical protein KR50_02460 [Jeotgalibacillus campisalis]
MGKRVTFNFNSSSYEGTEATEAFTLEELGIDANIDDKALKMKIDKVFQAWVWDKLNISFSVVIDEEKCPTNIDGEDC